MINIMYKLINQPLLCTENQNTNYETHNKYNHGALPDRPRSL